MVCEHVYMNNYHPPPPQLSSLPRPCMQHNSNQSSVFFIDLFCAQLPFVDFQQFKLVK